MARYIDADKLKERLMVGSELDPEPCKGFRSALLAMVDTQEDADVIPVVRCKECKHRIIESNDDWCECTGCDINPDGFCEEGERRYDAET